jgi:hypothetical protein
MPVRRCDSGHCSSADKELHEICKSYPAGTPVLTRDANGPCECPCSCLAYDTPVEVSAGAYQAVQLILEGHNVLAAGKDLKWKQEKVEYSQGTEGAVVDPFVYLIVYDKSKYIFATADQPFLVKGGKVKRASRLSTEDELVLADGNGSTPITLVENVTYRGGVHHIATKKEVPNKNLDGHLLNINGVVGGDYAVQLLLITQELAGDLYDKAEANLPIVGTKEYEAKHGAADRKILEGLKLFATPATTAETLRVAEPPNSSAPKDVRVVPAKRMKLDIPADACSFISQQDAQALAAAPKRALTDKLSQGWAEYLCTHFKAFYPDVTYRVDWYDDEVNAYAWVQNGTRYVALKGGLIRLTSLELEGISLVLAHELAHHYGGPPTYPHGLSCEGQADYYGALVIMRRAWFGEMYLTMMDKAIPQLKSLFGFIPVVDPVPAMAGCSHPPGACRAATYTAAVELKPKPACAG